VPSHAAADHAFALGFASRFQKTTSIPTSWWRIRDVRGTPEHGAKHRDSADGQNDGLRYPSTIAALVNKNGRPLKRQRWTVDPETECWNWLLAKHPRSGHGMATRNGKSGYAHRWAYEDAKGEIPARCAVLQTCGNHACVNPDHLVTETEPSTLNARGAAATTKKDDAKVTEALRLRRMGQTLKEIGSAVSVNRITVRRWLSAVAADSESGWIWAAALDVGPRRRHRKAHSFENNF